MCTEANNNSDIIIEGVDVLEGLKIIQGDEELYIEILLSFVESKDEIENNLLLAFENNDIKNYRIGAHSIKSQAYTIGAMALGDEAKKMEYAARDEDIALIRDNTASFVSHYNKIVNNVKNALKIQGVQIDKEVTTDIDKLINAIDDFDMDTALEILENIDGDTDTINSIKNAIDDLNYIDAHDLALKLR